MTYDLSIQLLPFSPLFIIGLFFGESIPSGYLQGLAKSAWTQNREDDNKVDFEKDMSKPLLSLTFCRETPIMQQL